jgi:hypothetical protein
MKWLNIETPVTRNFILQILLNVQDFYFHKFWYTSYDEGIFGPWTEKREYVRGKPPVAGPHAVARDVRTTAGLPNAEIE